MDCLALFCYYFSLCTALQVPQIFFWGRWRLYTGYCFYMCFFVFVCLAFFFAIFRMSLLCSKYLRRASIKNFCLFSVLISLGGNDHLLQLHFAFLLSFYSFVLSLAVLKCRFLTYGCKKGYYCCFVVDVEGDVDDVLIFAAVIIVFRKIKQWMDQLLPNLK